MPSLSHQSRLVDHGIHAFILLQSLLKKQRHAPFHVNWPPLFCIREHEREVKLGVDMGTLVRSDEPLQPTLNILFVLISRVVTQQKMPFMG